MKFTPKKRVYKVTYKVTFRFTKIDCLSNFVSFSPAQDFCLL